MSPRTSLRFLRYVCHRMIHSMYSQTYSRPVFAYVHPTLTKTTRPSIKRQGAIFRGSTSWAVPCFARMQIWVNAPSILNFECFTQRNPRLKRKLLALLEKRGNIKKPDIYDIYVVCYELNGCERFSSWACCGVRWAGHLRQDRNASIHERLLPSRTPPFVHFFPHRPFPLAIPLRCRDSWGSCHFEPAPAANNRVCRDQPLCRPWIRAAHHEGTIGPQPGNASQGSATAGTFL